MKKRRAVSQDTKLAVVCALLGVLILLTGVWLWYRFVFANPERTFWSMIDNNLRTYGTTRYINQSDEAGATTQYLQLELGAENIAQSLTTIERNSAEGATRIVTESIGTSDANFARYTDITTPQGVNFDAVLNKWGKETTDAASESQSILSEAVFGAVPLARLSPAQRNEITQFIKEKHVYKTDFATAQRTTVDGKAAYAYKVEIDTVSYIEMLKMIDRMMGLNQLELINPASYAGSPVIPMELSVGIDSRQLLRTRYDAIEREERFSGYGVQPRLQAPEGAMARPELEAMLQQAMKEN